MFEEGEGRRSYLGANEVRKDRSFLSGREPLQLRLFFSLNETVKGTRISLFPSFTLKTLSYRPRERMEERRFFRTETKEYETIRGGI